jgi:PAS domain S-box-containing protein
MLWLYLLAAVTVLGIALRRVIRRMTPLDDELYSKNVAIEHVNTGVAWVGVDGKIGAVNPALVKALDATQEALIGHEWCSIFAPASRDTAQEAFTQMLLRGKATFEARGLRSHGGLSVFDVLLIAVHDHKMRFKGHHCIAEDRTRERELQERLDQLTQSSSSITR